MKMVKSLLLGTAAGLVAVAGAQAADLPVKAKAVEYVKVCSLYGAGFYYIPGTDTCIKIGGFMRTEWNHNANGSFATQTNGANAFYTRAQDSLVNRSRVVMSFDVRSQTEYGTLRSYARAGWQWTTNTDSIGGSSSTVYLDRVFIQFAGFTFGKTQSFFDTPGIENMTYQTEEFRNNTGGSGTPVFAYTALLGNGVSATLSLEDASERRANIVDLTSATPSGVNAAGVPFAAGAAGSAVFVPGVSNPADNHGNEVPDIVANLRVDQAWGSAGISGALHLNQAQYYGANNVVNGHADDKWGWAVGAGVVLKAPWNPKDTFAVSAQYGEGASTYTFNVPGSFGARSLVANMVQNGGISLAWGDDAYYAGTPGSQLELSKSFSISGGFEHYWTNSLRSSIWGTYTNYEANSAAVNTAICTPRGFAADCADWSAYQIGSRTIWNPVSNLDIGLEVMYTKINTAFAGGVTTANFGGHPAGLAIKDNDVWSGILRVQRNFWP